MVVELQNGQGILFRSHKITHLNLKYTGERVSLVFHSDRSMDNWVKNFNDWGHNLYFRTTKSIPAAPISNEE